MTPVADAKGECVRTAVETVQCLFCLGIVEESTCPTLCRTKHIAIGEAATEDDEVDVAQRFPARNEVGHHDIFDVEACQVEHVGHFPLAICAFLADDSCFYATLFPTVRVQTILAEFACEAWQEVPFEWLLAVVFIAFFRLTIEALLAVEQITACIPNITKVINAKLILCSSLFHEDVSLFARTADVNITDSCSLKELLDLRAILVGNLNHDARVLCKEELHQVVAFHLVEVYLESAFCICEAHFQQTSDETACRDVVTGKNKPLLNQVLNGVEGIAEVLRITYRWHI